jgi:hypothetical protein
MKYMQKVLDLLNHEIRALIDNRNETIGRKLEMPNAKPRLCWLYEEEEKTEPFLSVVTDKKEKEISPLQ